uniref:NADH-ubiquinone oxidoreductase chain 4 n=1 Tax=Glena unipennaria TaxID=1981046 RepID=A0A343YVI6_9NEOP|nr:NADH dehydrogenase subunit 4 [Glena unipennaria]
MLKYNGMNSLIYMNLSIDHFSYFLILLTYWICSLMILSSEKLFKYNFYSSLFMLMILILMLSLYLTFCSLNLFIFYLFFEISLIPILMLVLGWGYQPERIEAGMYLLFYTLFFSLPMMVMIFYYYDYNNSLMFYKFNIMNNWISYLCMNMIFFVKLPMFFIHLWLPKAHVEASISGSMILAGIMLKLGGYGLIRLLKNFLPLFKFNLIFMNISLVGGFLVSLICLCQSDLKSLIAYSSVAHMGLVLSGLMTMSVWGINGAFILMLAHGLCSSGLFCLANINYERLMSRSLYLNKGMINLVPSLSFWWFMFSICNMAAPPSLNLMGEIFLINSLIFFSWITMLSIMLISFFSAVYSLFMYSYSQHGMSFTGLYSFYSGSIREYLLLFLHWFPLNLMILKGDLFI